MPLQLIGMVRTIGYAPPMALIPRVLRHAQACAAEGTLVVPVWPSAPFWPLLCPSGGKFAAFVVGQKDLPLSDTLFVPGPSRSVLFGGTTPNTRVLALRVSWRGSAGGAGVASVA